MGRTSQTDPLRSFARVFTLSNDCFPNGRIRRRGVGRNQWGCHGQQGKKGHLLGRTGIQNLSRRAFGAGAALLSVAPIMPARAQTSVTPAQARAIAKEAYVYGYPMVDSYRIQYAYFVDRGNPEYKAPWNQIRNFSRVFTPEDKAVQTPNSDTPYSFLGMDLRAEPVVLTVPPIEEERYFSIQLIDAYTFNFDYIGSRSTGNDGGRFLIAGPDWKGDEPPKGVKKVIRAETELVLAPYRTQLFNPGDIDNVKKV